MAIKQKLEDLKLLLQKNRKWQVGAAIGLGLLVLLFSMDNSPRKRRKKVAQVEQGSGAMPKNEAYQDLIEAFKENLTTLQGEATANREATQELKQDIDDYEARTAEIFRKILDRIDKDEPQNVGAVDPNDPYYQGGGAGMEAASFSEEPDTLEPFGDIEEPQIAPPPRPEPKKIALIGAADSVRVKLLAGVNAPTDGTPYPVIFKLVGDVTGPDGSALPLGEARVIAAAQGSLVDSRALFRLTKLSIRMPNGSRKTLGVDGWIVGEDGIRGMQGILLDPIGKAIAGSGMAGGLQGMGQAFSEAQKKVYHTSDGNLVEVVNGDVASYAAGKALSGAAQEWKSIIVNRVNQLVPQVKVFSGREATAVFAKSVKIEGLYDELENEVDIFSPLD